MSGKVKETLLCALLFSLEALVIIAFTGFAWETGKRLAILLWS